jgi:peptidyl-prolyl cis-trans isomerase C
MKLGRIVLNRRTRILFGGGAVALIIGSSLAVVHARVGKLPADAAFVLDNTVVTTSDVDDRVDVLHALYGVNPPKTATKLNVFRRDAAKAVAVGMIVDRAAKKRGIVIGDKPARAMLSKLIEERYSDGGRAAFIQALGSLGASQKQVLAEIKQQLVVSKTFDAVTKNVGVTDGEVAAAFERRKSALGTPELRTLSNIVIAKRSDADRVLDLTKSGRSFRSLARSYSIDAATKSKGGSLGAVSAGQLDPAYAKVAFVARPGRAFGPVRTQHGWNVGLVENVANPRPAVLSKVSADLRTALDTEKALVLWRKWLGSQIKEADITYADRYRPAHPNQLPDASASAAGKE